MPPWLVDPDDEARPTLWKWILVRAVAGLLGWGVYRTGAPTRWVIWSLAALVVLGASVCLVSGWLARWREPVGGAVYLTGVFLFQVAHFVGYVLLSVVVFRYGLSG